jgi:GlpG protein
MLYDYPKIYELTDKLIKLYGVEKLQSPETLPPEGQIILKEIQSIPHWQGYYDQFLAHFQGKAVQPAVAPMFEKIREGEVWRLFTPALLHTDFLHILFNMLWLLILGKQLEERLNPRRYMLLILIIGIFSNTCQYLMGGSNFMGFSGVVCGMVAFIWTRQKIAPWEGYPLERSSSAFVLYFILALLAIQMVSFYMEARHNTSISPGIANTAHITGALMGALLALTPFFKKNNTIARPTK